MDLIPYGLGAIALFLLLYSLKLSGPRMQLVIAFALFSLGGLLLLALASTLPPGFGTFKEPLLWRD